jgi:hypothetical protein
MIGFWARYHDIPRAIQSANQKYGSQTIRPPADGFAHYDDLTSDPTKPWITKGVIAEGEISSWFGPPGSGKSGLATDLGFHIAADREWRGYRSKSAGGVIFFALERGNLIKRRLVAYRERTSLTKLPITVVPGVIDIISPACVGYFLDTIKRCEDHWQAAARLIVIDTWAKAIAAGGGNENEASDQSRALANLRRVIDALPRLHIQTIGHTGKDENKGERGSNAKEGDADLAVQISGEKAGPKDAEVTKANDQQLGPLTRFEMVPHLFGLDDDGDPNEAWIVSPTEPMESRGDSRQELSGAQEIALRALVEVTLTHGQPAPEVWQLPRGGFHHRAGTRSQHRRQRSPSCERLQCWPCSFRTWPLLSVDLGVSAVTTGAFRRRAVSRK